MDGAESVVVLYSLSRELKTFRRNLGYRKKARGDREKNHANAFVLNLKKSELFVDSKSQGSIWILNRSLQENFPYQVLDEESSNGENKSDLRFYVRQRAGRSHRSESYRWAYADSENFKLEVIDGVLIVEVAFGDEHPILPQDNDDDAWWDVEKSTSHDKTDTTPMRNIFGDWSFSSSNPFSLDKTDALEMTKVMQESITQTGREVVSSLSKFASWAKKGIDATTQAVSSIETIDFETRSVRVTRKLADGGFSQIYLARSSDREPPMVVKSAIAHDKTDIESIRKEISLHRAIENEFVLGLLDCIEIAGDRGSTRMMMLFPYHPDGSIYDVMHQSVTERREWPFHERAIVHFMKGILSGLSSLHDAGFSHRDLKPHNILVERLSGSYRDCPLSASSNLVGVRPILMDLGSAGPLRCKVETQKEARLYTEEAEIKCSAPYRPPELFEIPNIPYCFDQAQDIWSLGTTLYSMSFGRMYSPFEHPTQGVLKLAILQGRVDFPNDSEYSKHFRRLLSKMMAKNAHERPTLKLIRESIEKLE